MMILFCAVLPVILGCIPSAVRFRKQESRARWAFFAVTLTSLMLAGIMIWGNNQEPAELFRLSDHFCFVLHLDRKGTIFLGIAAMLWPPAMLYAGDYMKHEKRKGNFFLWYTVAYGPAVLLGAAENLFTLRLTPEQAAVWSYPLSDADEEQTAFNMVNAMLLRIHQSGHLAEINRSGKKLVKEGIKTYKRIRSDIRRAIPFWPLGLSDYADPWVCLGLRTEHRAYVALWCRNPETDTVNLPIDFLQNKKVTAELLYPADAPCIYNYNPGTSSLTVKMPEPCSARIFLLRY